MPSSNNTSSNPQTAPWGYWVEATLAAQQQWMGTMQSLVASTFASQRTVLTMGERAIRNLDPTQWVPRDVAQRNLALLIQATPGITRHTANEAAREIWDGIEQANPLIGRAASEAREVSLDLFEDVEEALDEAEDVARASVRAMGAAPKRAAQRGKPARKSARRKSNVGEQTAAARGGRREAPAGKRASRKGSK